MAAKRRNAWTTYQTYIKIRERGSKQIKIENYVNVIGTAITKFTFTVCYFKELYAMKELQTKYYAKWE
jgi:hypothetical protein